MTDIPASTPSSRKRTRDIDSLRRERDSIIRILSQANFSKLSSELGILNQSISDLETELKGS
ncbi:MAG: hypothetical protein CMA26_00890 [Euryarchaeota archaeon]|nr:hypothetical protein [Euryarchaeota archaeon]